MANVFKNFVSNGVSTETSVMLVNAGTQTTIIGMNIANVGSTEATVDVKLTNTYIVKGLKIPTSSSAVVVGGDQKIVAVENDDISVSSTGSNVDVLISVLEITSSN